MDKRIVVAIGGNAILKKGQKGTCEEQLQNIYESCDPIIDLIEKGYRVMVTHGNGPQVGNTLLKAEAASKTVPVNPLDVCGAETQGSLGYLIQQSLYNRMRDRGVSKPAATVVTQVVVDRDDPGFKHPTKPIGPFYTKERAEELKRSQAMQIVEDSGRGYRRVVASPTPLKIVEKDVIESLIENDLLVIAAGGGGIPVVEEDGRLKGVEAVIDKDLASSLLAVEMKADYLMILTGVDKVSIHFGREDQQDLSELTISQAREYLEQGEFPKGSMGPKIEAALHFLTSGGKNVIITSIDKLQQALDGSTGTRIVMG